MVWHITTVPTNAPRVRQNLSEVDGNKNKAFPPYKMYALHNNCGTFTLTLPLDFTIHESSNIHLHSLCCFQNLQPRDFLLHSGSHCYLQHLHSCAWIVQPLPFYLILMYTLLHTHTHTRKHYIPTLLVSHGYTVLYECQSNNLQLHHISTL